MQNRAWSPPVLLILLTGSISPSGAQEAKVVLSGTVIDSVRRQPVSGVRILDRDGDLDLIFATELDSIDELYLNDGRSFFADVSVRLPAGGISAEVVSVTWMGMGMGTS